MVYEVDPSSHLSETTTRATASTIARNELCYLYKDKGSGHFGDFEFKLDVCLTAFSGGESHSSLPHFCVY